MIENVIFEGLACLPRWVPYALEWRPEKARYDKVPHSGRRGLSTTTPADWMTLEEALRLAEGNKLHGAGIVMTGPPHITDGDWVLLGIDFDKVNRSVVEIPFFEVFDSYTETSPSGTGLRGFAWVPKTWAKGFRDSVAKPDFCDHVEIYIGTAARFLTVTFEPVLNRSIRRLDPAALALLEQWMKPAKEPQQVRDFEVGAAPAIESLGLTHEEQVMFKGEYGGDRSELIFLMLVRLIESGHKPEDLLALMLDNEALWQYCLDHRKGRQSRAEKFAHSEVQRAFAKALRIDWGAPAEDEDDEGDEPHLAQPFDIVLPGVAGELAEAIMECSMQRVPAFAVAAALTTIAALTGGQFVLERTITPINSYFLLVGETGDGKDGYVRVASNILRQVPGADQRIAARENASSGQAIMRALGKSRSMLLMVDEVGHFIGAAKSRDNYHGQGMIAQIMSLFSMGHQIYAGRIYADTKQNINPIEAPFLQFIGATTPSKLWSVTTQEQIDEGWLNRFIVVYSDTVVQNDERAPSLPPGLVAKLTGIVAASAFINDLPTMHVGNTQLRLWPVEDKAHAFWRKKRDAMKGKGAMWVRAAEYMLRIAGLIAIADGRKVMVSDMEVAWRLVEWSITRTAAGTATEMAGETPFDKLCRRILSLIAKGETADKKYTHLCKPGEVPVAYIKNSISKKGAVPERMLCEAIKALVEAGRIKGTKIESGKGEVPGMKLVG